MTTKRARSFTSGEGNPERLPSSPEIPGRAAICQLGLPIPLRYRPRTRARNGPTGGAIARSIPGRSASRSPPR